MLTKMEIHGFKSIRKLDELQLRNLNILIGPNGAGKSNLIAFFRMLNWMTGSFGNLQTFIGKSGGADALLHDGSAKTQHIKASLSFETTAGINEYDFSLSHAAKDTLIFVDEKYRFSRHEYPSKREWSSLDSGHKEARIIERIDKTAEVILGLMKNCVVHQFHNTSETARIRNRWNVEDNVFLKEDGGNLAPFLYRLRENEQPCYRRIVETIRLIIPFFDDFVLIPDYGSILLQWREINSDLIFSPSLASDGTLRIMALISLLLQPYKLIPNKTIPTVIILDEPELGLHPAAINVIAGLLKSVSVNHQVIVATQSVTFVDQFDPEDIIVVDRIGRESTFKRLDAQQLNEWLEEYSIGELWEKNVIGGRPAL
ncbi:MAG: AAA family ATPase [Candidatus Omnitrophota bacterium]